MNHKTIEGEYHDVVIERLVFQMELLDHEYQEPKLNAGTQKLAELEFIQGEQVGPWAGISPLDRRSCDNTYCQNAKSNRGQHNKFAPKFWQAVDDNQVSGETNCNRR